jgi:tetratricopeptide (TPR) repeat protein
MGRFYGGLDVGRDEGYRRAEQSALRALELDLDLAEAHAALAAARLLGAWDVEAGERGLRRAIELNPNLAQAHNWLGDAINARGNAGEALASFRRARDLDPFSPLMNRDFAKGLYFVGRCEESIEAARTALTLDPGHTDAYWYLRACYRSTGRTDEAAEAAARFLAEVGAEDAAEGVRAAYDSQGWTGLLEAELELFLDASAYPWAAGSYAELGRVDEAFDALFTATEVRSATLIMVKVMPNLEPLHSDPRWEEVLRRAGF